MVDYTNQKWNKLTALRETSEKDKQGLIIWEFKCDCGNLCKAPLSLVKRGRKKSCGCLPREILINRNIANGQKTNIGDVYGKLTVIEDIGYRKNSRGDNMHWWKCQCECGNIIEVVGQNLHSGCTQSCGCTKSRGERAIRNLLIKNKIPFKTEYSFNDCLGLKGGRLRFDFAVFDKDGNLFKLIEFDGRQHIFGPDAAWKNSYSLEEIQARDKIKDDYCKKNNFILQRVPYTDINKISLEYLGLDVEQLKL